MKLILSKFLLIFFVSNYAFGYSCEELRSIIIDKKNSDEKIINELKSKIQADDQCVKNIYGVMLARGIFYEKDPIKAYSIFWDLAQKDYPPAQLNLAIYISRDDKTNPEVFLNYVLGLVVTNFSSKKWGNIATSARDLGRNYIDNKIKESINIEDKEKLKDLERTYEESIKTISVNTAVDLLNNERAERQQQDAIVQILAAGAMAAQRAAIARAGSYQAPQIRLNSPNRIYHVTPMGGNLLYIMPIN
jgi:hypothetical protein